MDYKYTSTAKHYCTQARLKIQRTPGPKSHAQVSRTSSKPSPQKEKPQPRAPPNHPRNPPSISTRQSTAAAHVHARIPETMRTQYIYVYIYTHSRSALAEY